jgi:carbonic anhydrase
MKSLFVFLASFLSVSLFADPIQVSDQQNVVLEKKMTPDKALQALVEGNKRFASEQSIYPNQTSEQRRIVAELQKPFAAILGCSDSRVAPELLFDQGLGDVFIVRVAGNVAGDLELDSIDYAVLHLYSSIVVVLGHENCGAVHAVLEKNTKGIPAVAKLIEPSIRSLRKEKDISLEKAIKENVKAVVKQLQKASTLAPLIKEKKLAVVGAYYDFDTGLVEWL